jgi:hypothetical protein
MPVVVRVPSIQFHGKYILWELPGYLPKDGRAHVRKLIDAFCNYAKALKFSAPFLLLSVKNIYIIFLLCSSESTKLYRYL